MERARRPSREDVGPVQHVSVQLRHERSVAMQMGKDNFCGGIALDPLRKVLRVAGRQMWDAKCHGVLRSTGVAGGSWKVAAGQGRSIWFQ